MGDSIQGERRTVRGAKANNGSLLLIFAILLVFFGCREGQIDYPPRQVPVGMLKDARQINAGYQLFMDKCASCHGKLSEGRSDRADFFKPAAPDFTDAHYLESDPAYLYWRIEVGKTVEPYRTQGSVMPAWGAHFSEERIWQIVAYLRARAH